jgi:hypothetical protein|nr:MAG TPA: DNA-directed RNA polymerase II subunit [Caudoviricetes sp.]
MAKYIRAVEAAEKVEGTFKIPMADLVDIFAEIPAADVAPVVHGRWIKDDFLSDDVNNAEKCSQCGELIGWFGNLPNYCPNCGAKMDGGDGDAKSM